MKPLYYLLFGATILFACSCNKDNIGNTNPALTGTWKLKASYSSIGGPQLISTALDTSLYVQFSANGKLQGTAFSNYTNYSIIDSITVALKNSSAMQNYYYNIRHDTLTMGNLACIEGCEVKFVKK